MGNNPGDILDHSVGAFQARAQNALLAEPPVGFSTMDAHDGPSDFRLNPTHNRSDFLGAGNWPQAAAVLVPICERGGAATVILTERTKTLRAHAGQIAFPGGRKDEGDEGPTHTALREAQEEIGLEADHVTVLGFLDTYLTGTGYLVSPVVGMVSAEFVARPDPGEVADVFEVPLGFLMDPSNHQTHARDIDGKSRRFVAMPFEDRYIWGATAGMLKNLYDRVYC